MMDFKARVVSDTASPKLKKLRQNIGNVRNIIELTYVAKGIIQQRTLAGIDADGQAFVPYSKEEIYIPAADDNRPAGYPKPAGGTLTKSGRTMKFSGYDSYHAGLGLGATPTLSLSNQMLGSMQGTILSPTRSILSYHDRLSAAKAHGHTVGANNLPIREHLDIRDVDGKADLLKAFTKAMRQARKAAGFLKGGVS